MDRNPLCPECGAAHREGCRYRGCSKANRRERPLLFSAPMVRATLAGTKTQTRRLVKPQPYERGLLCPYGVPGDELWVRETWALGGPAAADNWRRYDDPALFLSEHLRFRADDNGYDRATQEWRPSIHMPRWASRIQLCVTSVRVERLQEISEADARAEGVTDSWPEIECNGERPFSEGFRWLWDSINAERAPWASNPYVWVIGFERVKP